ncbi:hypothetical protein SDEG_2016 [Streptococcus dysgalactiae subsp. equisimilis GGS_124]|nr:hypothetical protein SDEG_2016 [Streptococcus dysgalactiae subsp. equisimilis GGS_124]
MGNSSISDKHVFFVALHFTTRDIYLDKKCGDLELENRHELVVDNWLRELFNIHK